MFFIKHLDNTLSLQLFQLMRFGCLILIGIVFAKIGLSLEEIGMYEIFLFLSALLCSFWINGIIQSFLPLYKNNQSFAKTTKKSPEIFNAFLLISLLSIAAVVVLAAIKTPLAQIFTPGSEIPFYRFLLIYTAFNCPTFLIEYILLLKNRPKKIISYGVILFSSQFMLVVTPAILGYSFELCMYGLILTSLGKYIYLLILLHNHASFIFSYSFIREHINGAIPLTISALLGNSARYIDDFLVMNKFDSTTFAIFKYGAREFPLILLMVSALSNAMITEFSDSKNLKYSLLQLKEKSKKLMHFLFPVSIIMLLCSEWLYPKVFNLNFTESAQIFNIYILLIISRLIFPHPILIGMKKTSIIMQASLVELVLNIALSILFVNFWGIQGIALATLLAFSLQKLIWISYLKRQLHIAPKHYIPIRELSLYSLLIILAFFYVFFLK